MPKFKHDAPLPHFEEKIRKADEREAFGVDSNHRKFSAREMLRRIAQHKAGEPITLRAEDQHFHEALEDSGLVDLSKNGEQKTFTRSHATAPEQTIETLTFRMEQIHEIRIKLLGQMPTQTTD